MILSLTYLRDGKRFIIIILRINLDSKDNKFNLELNLNKYFLRYLNNI